MAKMSLGQGFASFGENFARGRQAQADLDIRKQALKQQKDEFELNKQIKEAELDELLFQKSERDRLQNVAREASRVSTGIKPLTDQVTELRDIPFQDIPQDRSSQSASDFLSSVDFDQLPSLQKERTFSDITTETPLVDPESIPNSVSNSLRRISSGATGRSGKTAKGNIDNFVKNLAEEKSEKEFENESGIVDRVKKAKDKLSKGTANPRTKGSLNQLIKDFEAGKFITQETEESKQRRKDLEGEIKDELLSGDIPTTTTRVPDEPLGVERLPEEQDIPQPTAEGFLERATPDELDTPSVSPIIKEEVVIQDARLKTPQEMQTEARDKLNAIDGFSDLPLKTQEHFFNQAMVGQLSEQEQAELNLTKARTKLTQQQTSDLLREMGSPLGAGNLKEAQAKHVLHYNKMRESGKELRALLDPNGEVGFDPTSLWSGIQDVLGAIPFGNYLVDVDKQRYDSIANAWVQSVLRPESGAAIPENELKAYIKTYIPKAGDKPEAVEAKLRLMANTEKAMKSVLSIQGLDDKQVFTKLRELAPASDLKLLKTLNTKQDIRDAVDNGVLSPQDANDIANLKSIDFESGVNGITIKSIRKI